MGNRMNRTAVENLKVCESVEIVKHADDAFSIAVYLSGNCSKIHGANGEIFYGSESLARRAIKRLRKDLEPTFKTLSDS